MPNQKVRQAKNMSCQIEALLEIAGNKMDCSRMGDMFDLFIQLQETEDELAEAGQNGKKTVRLTQKCEKIASKIASEVEISRKSVLEAVNRIDELGRVLLDGYC